MKVILTSEDEFNLDSTLLIYFSFSSDDIIDVLPSELSGLDTLRLYVLIQINASFNVTRK